VKDERGERKEERDAREHILAYIASHHVLTLATEHNHVPWAASLFYANDGLTLYFVSDPETRHAQNIAANPHVAATIHEDYDDWRSIQGVQLEGACREITDPIESARARVVYASKFPFIADLLRAPRELGAAFARARWYKIEPTWARFTDNTRGFGWKEVLSLRAS